MNPFVLMTMLSAAQASQQPRNGHKSTTAVRRRVFMRACPRRDSRTPLQKRRSLFVRGAIAVALMIAFIIGLILFSFAV